MVLTLSTTNNLWIYFTTHRLVDPMDPISIDESICLHFLLLLLCHELLYVLLDVIYDES
jgi:hypothetical protein